MSQERTVSGVEAIELEAEEILKKARAQANDILLKANEEVNRILSPDVALDQVKAECASILEKAKQEAERSVQDARGKSSGIRTDINQKIEGTISRIVSDIAGVETR